MYMTNALGALLIKKSFKGTEFLTKLSFINKIFLLSILEYF